MSSSVNSETFRPSFNAMGLADHVLGAIASVGYENPSPIQAATIPPLLAGKDVLGQAQTGTGKTAAFALPILSRLRRRADAGRKGPSALVLAPTRELAIQVAEAFQRYAAGIDGFHVLPIYGGQAYGPQLAALRRGVDVVVGTPGRVIDHLGRGTLRLDAIDWLVLDEADEMLRMGFIEDVEKILAATPAERQIALFSATLPHAIRRIAKTHLRSPQEVTIETRTTTAENIRQRYWIVGGGISKLEALTRLLEAEPFDAAIVFARTKKATDELAERIAARGHACAALNGDIVQAQRERTIAQLKSGQLDIIVATDVAARGLDVERISHVINFDIPHDTESYVHRIGRTGRAGRQGDAILFVTMREKRLFKNIERATGQAIEPMDVPSVAEMNAQRIERFRQRITDTLATENLAPFSRFIETYSESHDVAPADLAAALAYLAQRDEPLALGDTRQHPDSDKAARDKSQKDTTEKRSAESASLETFRIEVGRVHGIAPRNIVGAIANETGLDNRVIGRISIQNEYSLVDLPADLGDDVLSHLKTVVIANRPLEISRSPNRFEPTTRQKPGKKDKPRHKKSRRKAKSKTRTDGKSRPKRKRS